MWGQDAMHTCLSVKWIIQKGAEERTPGATHVLGKSASPSVISERQRDTMDTSTALVTSFTVEILSGMAHSTWRNDRNRMPSASSISTDFDAFCDGRR